MTEMIKPEDVSHPIFQRAFEIGQETANALVMCYPSARSPDDFDRAMNSMASSLAGPFQQNALFGESMITGIQASALSGFLDAWSRLFPQPTPPADEAAIIDLARKLTP